MPNSRKEIPKHKTTEFKEKNSQYCVCIPIINEGEKIKKQLVGMKSLSKIIDILVLDGGSTDGSTEHKFLKANGVRALLVKQEIGWQSTQLRMGIFYGLSQGYEGIIIIDGNGKDGVDRITDFIKKLDEGY